MSGTSLRRRAVLTGVAATGVALASGAGRWPTASASASSPIPVPVGALVAADDFAWGLPAAWQVYDGPCANGGVFTPETVGTTSDGLLITASGSAVGGMSRRSPQLYGVYLWRGVATAISSGELAGPVDKPAVGLWPQPPATWTTGGELDAFETNDSRTVANFTAHWFPDGSSDSHRMRHEHVALDATSPHDYGLLWTAEQLVWFIDGIITYQGQAGDNLVLPDQPMHPFIQIGGTTGNTDLTCRRFEQYQPA